MKRIVVRQLSGKSVAVAMGGLFMLAFAIAGSVLYFKDNSIGGGIGFVFAALFVLLGIYGLLKKQIVFGEKTLNMPKSFYNPNGADIQYGNLISVRVILKEDEGNHVLDEKGKKTDTIMFLDNDGKSYRLPTRFFSPKQVQFIIDETTERIKRGDCHNE